MWYGVVIGILMGIALASYRAKCEGLDGKAMQAIYGGVLGRMLVAVVFYRNRHFSVMRSTTAFAAGGSRGRNFVDIDNDGVCDYYNTSCQFVDSDGDGICDNYGSNGCRNGAGYVDADGDGICDNYANGTSQNGSGFRRGRCGGQGRRGR